MLASASALILPGETRLYIVRQDRWISGVCMHRAQQSQVYSSRPLPIPPRTMSPKTDESCSKAENRHSVKPYQSSKSNCSEMCISFSQLSRQRNSTTYHSFRETSKSPVSGRLAKITEENAYNAARCFLECKDSRVGCSSGDSLNGLTGCHHRQGEFHCEKVVS
jgi:hypothetical protein